MIKLLIVDDETAERRALCRSVDWSIIGGEVVGDAWNGKQAIELAMQTRPDIVITDVKMPVMDGVEMAKKVCALDPSIKIVFCSAYEDFGYAREAANLNAFGYVLKPIDDEELLRTVKKAVDKCIEERMQGALFERLKSSLTLSEPLLREAIVRNELLGLGREPEALLRSVGLDWLRDEEEPFGLMLIRWLPEDRRKTEEIKSLLSERLTGRTEAVCAQISAGEIAVTLRLHANAVADEAQAMLERTVRGLDERLAKASGFRLESLFRLYPAGTAPEEAYRQLSSEPDEGRLRPADSGFAAAGAAGIGAPLPEGYSSAAADPLLRLRAEAPRLLRQGDEGALYSRVRACFRHADAPDADDPALECGVALSVLTILADAVRSLGFEPFSGIDEEIVCWTGLVRQRSADGLQSCLEEWVRAFAGKARTGKEASEDSFLKPIRRIVGERYASTLTVESIAQSLHFTPNYLGATFKAKTGVSLNDYINKYRVTVSMGLLRDPSLGIYEIARRCGYENTPYFHKMFKKHTGMTPGEYRLLERGAAEDERPD
ncbi:response regulator transcription factor [Cohnella zeiphila]|uniref:Response regulator n=1 Tax=Cohnella zeiphila TaxID=2761120 RepID=A0A7X0VXH9_9BACL|nr:response regulator [Cohnella zeiphila]MBB6733462.1 response regulator [Cohnella zeiphila]